MPSNDHCQALRQMLDELDRIVEDARVADGRDPNALAECERKLDELRRRIERLGLRKGRLQ